MYLRVTWRHRNLTVMPVTAICRPGGQFFINVTGVTGLHESPVTGIYPHQQGQSWQVSRVSRAF